MSWISDAGKFISRPVKKAVRDPLGTIKDAAHNPITQMALTAGTIATAGLLAPVQIGISTYGVADNINKHGVVGGIKRTASEQIAQKDPRTLLNAARKLLPSDLQRSKVVNQLVHEGLQSVPGAAGGLSLDQIREAALRGNPRAIVRAAASGLELTGGQKLTHNTAIQSAINKLPSGTRRTVASSINAVTKMHDAVQGRLKIMTRQEQLQGLRALFIPLGSKQRISGRFRMATDDTGQRGFLIDRAGRLRIGTFRRVG